MQDLWAELNNEQLATESAGRKQKQELSRRRRLTEQAIISSLRDWIDALGSGSSDSRWWTIRTSLPMA